MSLGNLSIISSKLIKWRDYYETESKAKAQKTLIKVQQSMFFVLSQSVR